MTDIILEKRTVVQSNELVSFVYRAGFDERKLLNLALSTIDSPNPKPKDAYKITVDDFQKAFNIDKHHAANRLRNAAKNLNRSPIVIDFYDDNGKLKTIEKHWFDHLEYQKDADIKHVTVIFSDFVESHLYSLGKKTKGGYTSAKLENLTKMDFDFSHRLYFWLREKIQKDRITNKEKTKFTTTKNLEWVKKRLLLQGKYKDFKDFRVDVLEPAINEINTSTDLSVTFEAIKKGRGGKVESVKFYFIEESKDKIKKPPKPDLPLRPNAKKGSHQHGQWCRECINIIEHYRAQLKEYSALSGNSFDLKKTDFKRLATWHEIIGDKQRSKVYQAEADKLTKVKKEDKPTEPDTANSMISLYSVMLKDESALSPYEKELKEAYKNVPLDNLKGVLVPQKKIDDSAIGEVEPTDFESQRLAAIEAERKALEAVAPQAILSDSQQQELIESTSQHQEIANPTDEKAAVNMAAEAMKKLGIRSRLK